MRFIKYYYLIEQVFNNWKSALSQSQELKAAVDLMKEINRLGYECLIVGGSVRDLILGKVPNDIDLVTNIPPSEIEKHFETHDIGKNKAFGVSVVKYKGFIFELANYRADLYDKIGGKGADRVEIVSDFKSDVLRRDYSINGLGIDADGNIIDHVGGLKDIENKIISSIGDPNLRFKEDQVRTLRGVRFASRLGFTIDPKTAEAIKSNAPEIKNVAMERVLKELWKMAEQSGERFANAIIMLKDLNLLQYIIPELLDMRKMKHSEINHPEGERDEEGDPTVWGHTIEALKTYKGNDPVVNFAILLHDIGKTKTHALSDSGKHTYHGHAKESGKMIDEIGKRLRMNNKTIEAIKFVADNHMNYFDIPKMNNKTVAQLLRSPYFDILEQVALADSKARGASHDENEWKEIQDKIVKVKELVKGKDVIDAVKKVVNGALIMRLRPDIKPGPDMGKIINDTIEYVINNEIDLDNMETITDYVENWKK
ncbi:MAG: CCA tRNA nucleotidyltransferase [Candidatus Woesearchaeota archaeon]